MPDRSETEYAIRLPNGTIETAISRQHAENLAAEATERLHAAGSDQEAVVVTRTKTVVYSEWEEDDDRMPLAE